MPDPLFSGGEAEHYSWTQTEAEVELRINTPPGTTGRDLDIRFRPLQLSVTVAGNTLAEGQLEAPVTADECVWTLELGGNAEIPVLAISLPKAKHEKWKRLFKTDREQRVQCLDGERTDAIITQEKQRNTELSKIMFAAAAEDDLEAFREALETNADSSAYGDEAEKMLFTQLQTQHGTTLLHTAAGHGSVKVIRCILDVYSPALNAQQNEGSTALILAVANKHSGAAAMLLEARADVRICSHNGTTALHHAAKFGEAQTVALLLDAGASIDAKHELAGTALHWAASVGVSESLTVLLDRGANPNSLDQSGSAPLHAAVSTGSVDCCRALIEANADIHAALLSNGKTAMHLAAEKALDEVVELLIEADPDTVGALSDDGAWLCAG